MADETKQEITAEIVHQKIQTVLKETNYKVDYAISFPVYRIIPDEVQLALKVISKHGMKITMTLIPRDASK